MSAPAEVPFEVMSTITREQLRGYAAASGDQNPIHLDDEVAKANGLPGVIAHGMLNAAFMAERAQRFAATLEGGWRLVRFNTRFRSMVFPGDTISVGGIFKNLEDGALSLELRALNAKGDAVVTGTAVFRRPS